MKLSSHIVEKPWGRFDLPNGFVTPDHLKPDHLKPDHLRIGEIWYDDANKNLPLLVKWLFTSEKLSVQVHPNDAQAKSYGLSSGKEECWLITDARPGATLGIGTKRSIDSDELRALSLSGDIENLIDWKSVKAGDYYYIPAGTVHAIGPDVTLIEVQQNADITYRLYDYGRPRELHLDHGVAVSDARIYDDVRSGTLDHSPIQQLVDGPHFNLWHCRGTQACEQLHNGHDSWIIPITGALNAGETLLKTGDCGYGIFDARISASENSTFLVAQQA